MTMTHRHTPPRRLLAPTATAVLSLGLWSAALAQDRFDSPGRAPQPSAAPSAIPQPGMQPPGMQQPDYGYSAPAPASARPDPQVLLQLEAEERRDHGVPAPRQLHRGAMHGPTPASIPGARLVTTRELVAMLQGNGPRPLMLDILGSPEQLPGAVMAVPAHQAGTFEDDTQRGFGQFLQQATQGRRDQPLVLYCASVQCWMSYNAALRAAALGYTQVLWYRGGIQAWKQAGLPLQGGQGLNGGPNPGHHPAPLQTGGHRPGAQGPGR
jgi:PQQ-dependent catabolism-associated CXXCW motif protein